MQATGNDTYSIPLDLQFQMISAYNPDTPYLSYHGKTNHFNFAITLLNSGGGCSFEQVTIKSPSYHGYIMWFAWTVFGLA